MSPTLANVGAATLGGTTIVAAADHCTLSPQMTLADRRLNRFTEQIIKEVRQPMSTLVVLMRPLPSTVADLLARVCISIQSPVLCEVLRARVAKKH
jgi:hypothetical protein